VMPSAAGRGSRTWLIPARTRLNVSSRFSGNRSF
jgi:hypothetical protein